jgi:HJR/Mrr/RecB family endonuclease
MEFLKQIQSAQKIASMVNTPAMQEALGVVNTPVIQQAYQSLGAVSSAWESIQPVADKISMLSEFANNNIKGILSSSIEYYTSLARIESNAVQSFQYERISAYIGALANYKLAHYYPDNISDEDTNENIKADNKIITEIFKPDKETDEEIDKKESAIIILSPVNDRLLKYLSENPEAFYQLKDRKFEEVMAEIYSKLGYKVELTKATRDGGKDIIIRRPEILGDFIYYVECKKYAPNNPVGIGLVKNLVGTVDADRVNGGILATTSYFTPDARKFVTDNKYDYQIQMHDYNKIREMLNQVV